MLVSTSIASPARSDMPAGTTATGLAATPGRNKLSIQAQRSRGNPPSLPVRAPALGVFEREI
ncbi:hypothetical protein INR49_028566 [Caranx melampygus]|nr:hypothetical protein INR49_000554 [Caranx melampygus]KAG7239740.1 hypothetical protein INR49_028566 [Caranx melampygus]